MTFPSSLILRIWTFGRDDWAAGLKAKVIELRILTRFSLWTSGPGEKQLVRHFEEISSRFTDSKYPIRTVVRMIIQANVLLVALLATALASPGGRTGKSA